MKRRLLTCFAALSLLLCVATVALWIRSYSHIDTLTHGQSTSVVIETVAVKSILGEVDYMTITAPNKLEPLEVVPGWSYDAASASLPPGVKILGPEPTRTLGFGCDVVVLPGTSIFGRSWAIPHWSLALLFAILPAIRVRAYLRDRKRARVGMCQVCGYDLRATPDRCPECGTVVVAGSR